KWCAPIGMRTLKPLMSIGFFDGQRRYSHHSRSSPGPTVYGAVRGCRPCSGLRQYGFSAAVDAGARTVGTKKRRSPRMPHGYARGPGTVKRRRLQALEVRLRVGADATRQLVRILFDDDLVGTDLEERLSLADDDAALDQHLGHGARECRGDLVEHL